MLTWHAPPATFSDRAMYFLFGLTQKVTMLVVLAPLSRKRCCGGVSSVTMVKCLPDTYAMVLSSRCSTRRPIETRAPRALWKRSTAPVSEPGSVALVVAAAPPPSEAASMTSSSSSSWVLLPARWRSGETSV